jgi:hypothetical protein
MILEFLIATQLQVSPVPKYDLEQLYWDCDTAYMKGQLEPKDVMRCLDISDLFVEEHFKGDMNLYKEYWEKNKKSQWTRRGYTK